MRTKVIRRDDITADEDYEKGARIQFGINDATCDSRKVVLGHTVFPAGFGGAEAHFHAKCDAVWYVIKGRMRIRIGQGDDCHEVEARAGDFGYFAQGEVHSGRNPSDTEEAEVVFAYAGVPNKEAAGTTFAPQP